MPNHGCTPLGKAINGDQVRRPYEPAAYGAASLDGCYWTTTTPVQDWPRLEGDHRTEFAVIGAGYTGLSAALELARFGASVTVLEAHDPGWGASGRNGGFCCLGGAKLSDPALQSRYGADGLQRYSKAERAAVDLVASRIETLGLSVDRHSDGELLLAHSPRHMEGLRDRASGLTAVNGDGARILEPRALAEEGVSAAGTHGGLHIPVGFALNPRKYVLGLAQGATAAGAKVYGQSPVTRMERVRDTYLLHTEQGVLRARHLILATNGYSSDDLPAWMQARFLPVQSSILVTRPLSAAERRAQGWTSDLMAYDSRRLLHYFRLMPCGRFLFGMRGGVRWSAREQASIRAGMRRDFAQMFPAWADVETPHFWSGLACLARDGVPFCGAIGDWPKAWAGFAYHGNGVAMGTWVGQQLARLATGRPHDLPEFFQAPPKRWELGHQRRLLLRLAYGVYGAMDRLGV